MRTKTYLHLYYILTKFTNIKHENNTNIIQSLGTYKPGTYLRKRVNQKKIEIYPDENKNRYKFE